MVSSDDKAVLIHLDSKSLIPFTSAEKTTHCSAFVPLDSRVHKISFVTDDNNATYILTLLRDLKRSFLKTHSPLS